MKNPNPNMLLKIAQGDAFAAAAEFNADKARLFAFDKYYQHPGHEKLKPGMYTDDTQMSIANAEVLISRSKNIKDVTNLDFADSWVKVFKRDERDGYARRFQRFLETTKNGQGFLSNIKPVSNRNGAAMRSVPLGVIPDINDVIDIALQQSSLTHATTEGMLSSVIVASCSHFALYTNEPFKYFPDFLDNYLRQSKYDYIGRCLSSLETNWSGSVPCRGMATAQAVVTLLKNYDNLFDMMRQTILWGGDTDSVASIAWGIASARYDDELPDFFENDLEQGGNFGVDFLNVLGENLMSAYSPTVPELRARIEREGVNEDN